MFTTTSEYALRALVHLVARTRRELGAGAGSGRAWRTFRPTTSPRSCGPCGTRGSWRPPAGTAADTDWPGRADRDHARRGRAAVRGRQRRAGLPAGRAARVLRQATRARRMPPGRRSKKRTWSSFARRRSPRSASRSNPLCKRIAQAAQEEQKTGKTKVPRRETLIRLFSQGRRQCQLSAMCSNPTASPVARDGGRVSRRTTDRGNSPCSNSPRADGCRRWRFPSPALAAIQTITGLWIYLAPFSSVAAVPGAAAHGGRTPVRRAVRLVRGPALPRLVRAEGDGGDDLGLLRGRAW